ncbi:MAG: hypothetical protein K2G28_01460, partial [Acetatifactor sp.]|nr:hypothetical protein [Acetatifactor sp.]
LTFYGHESSKVAHFECAVSAAGMHLPPISYIHEKTYSIQSQYKQGRYFSIVLKMGTERSA